MDATLTQSVKIGPEFFSNAFNDYASPREWVFTREALQNSIDAEAGRVSVEVSMQGDDTLITVDDDGCGMNRDVLVDKLLALGGSTKANSAATVGGFGVAKLVLLMFHKSYRIETRDLVVDGSGAMYRIAEGPRRQGTKLSVVWAGDHYEALTETLRRFAAFTQWSGQLFLNGQRVATNLHKGSPRREFPFGQVYTNRTFSNALVLRLRGIPMVVTSIDWEGCVVMELSGSAASVLSANRDGLRYPHSQTLQNFITSLSIDKRSALRNRQVSYTRYQGPQVTVTSQMRQAAALTSVLTAAATVAATTASVPAPAPGCAGAMNRVLGIQETVTERNEVTRRATIKVSTQFVLKNSTSPRLVTPTYYQPDSESFGHYSIGLATIWTNVLVELHRLFNLSRSFSVGFILDEEAEAEVQTNGDFGTVFYINPAVIVTQQNNSNGRSFKKRFRLTERHRILALACHELVHAMGFGPHDELFSSRLTDVCGIVMANLRQFNHCFAQQSV